MHLRICAYEALHRFGKDIQDGRLAGADIQVAGIQFAELRRKVFLELVDAVDQGFGEKVEGLALGRQLQMRAASFEQGDAEFALQSLDLQGY
jgi:hypothetical protein